MQIDHQPGPILAENSTVTMRVCKEVMLNGKNVKTVQNHMYINFTRITNTQKRRVRVRGRGRGSNLYDFLETPPQ